MAARAIGSGSISFGLVSIPVKLYSTTESAASISFNMLHEKCGTKVKYRYYCPTDDTLIEHKELIKGYEFAKGQFVTFSDEEIKSVSEESTKAIEITEFVPADSVDPMYFDKAYYLGPDKGGDRAYALLGEAMRETGRVGLAKYTARGKQYLVMLRPVDGGVVMQQLRYADEVRSIDQVPIAETDIKAAELKLAVQFVEQIAADEFHPENYEDEVRQRLQEAIQRKVDGEQITSAPADEPKAQIIDLMEALKASLSMSDDGAAAGKTKKAAPKKSTAKSGARPAKAKSSRKSSSRKKAAT